MENQKKVKKRGWKCSTKYCLLPFKIDKVCWNQFSQYQVGDFFR